jgi:hypothetical protein
MTDRLRLTLERDTDGTGGLVAEASSGGFSGVGMAWFNLSQIDEFGELLASTYPLAIDGSYKLQGGIWTMETPGTLSQPKLGLQFYPVGALGVVGCRAHLTSDDQRDGVATHSAVIELRTNYEQLRNFGIAVSALAEGMVDEAVL